MLTAVNETRYMANYSEFELYLKDEHFDTILQAKLEHFYLFDPFRAKNLTFGPFFNKAKKRKLLYWRNGLSKNMVGR